MIEFGTAGMRGKMLPGPEGINEQTIAMASAALALTLTPDSRIIIAYDTRRNSKEFAYIAAGVLAASGIRSFIFDRYSPVPLLSFAVRQLNCQAGIAITASHNTAEYNGFKVYGSDGAQMTSESTDKISEKMKDLDFNSPIQRVAEGDENIITLGDEIIDAFMEAVKIETTLDDSVEPAHNLEIIYTPIHGSGRDYVMRALEESGFNKVHLLHSQEQFDGNFPTVEKPNPEEREALKPAAEELLRRKADILIATDPDCDRIAIAARKGEQVEYFTGNETAALLIDFMAKTEPHRRNRIITSIVAGQIGTEVAQDHNLKITKTHIGFKNICNAMKKMPARELLVAYEESCGYLVGTHVRDKDGVSAAVKLCQMAAYYKKRGETLCDVMKRLYDMYGFRMDGQESFDFDDTQGREIMDSIMDELTSEKSGENFSPLEITGVIDYSHGRGNLEPAPVVKYMLRNGSWFICRQSGTEPKLKFYISTVGQNTSETQTLYNMIKEKIDLLVYRHKRKLENIDF